MNSGAATRLPVTAMIFTLDEEIHLPSCLESLRWCDDIVIIDSFSSDRTLEIARLAGARVLQNRFSGFGDQRNWALKNAAPRHPWVLVLDADERVPPEMTGELERILPAVAGDVAAFQMARRFYFWGRWLRYSSLYPSYVVRLVRHGRVVYVNRGHAETQQVDGEIRSLGTDLIDENLKGLAAWFSRQNWYSSQEAAHELREEQAPFRIKDVASADPLARRAALKRIAAALPGRPVWYFLFSYVVRGGFLDGTRGFVFCLLKAAYQAMIVMKKYELRQSAAGGPQGVE